MDFGIKITKTLPCLSVFSFPFPIVIIHKGSIYLPKFLFLVLFLCGTAFITAQGADTTEAVLAEITELLSASKYNEAITLFDTIPSPGKDSSRLRLLKASVLSSAGKYAEARALADGVSKAEPNNTEALFVLAAIEGAQGRLRQQQSALERIIKIEPNNTEANLSLGNLRLKNRSVRAAATHYQKALNNEPENIDALIGLSRAFRMNKEWDRAEVILNQCVKLYPDMPEARSERARFYWGRGFLVQALADLDEAKKLAPGDYWISTDRGSLLVDMNRKTLALEEFKRAISLNPNEYLAYIYSAGLKDDLGDFDGAERDYAVLAKMKPDYHYGLEGLGLHKMKNEKWSEARDAFMEAYKQAPLEHLYGLLAAINWMKAENAASARQFLGQVQAKVKRDTLEWYMFRLYYDLTARNYAGENDMIIRLDQEKDNNLKARMLFYMAQYYDIRGNAAVANKYYLMVNELDTRAIPEWRLNEWIMTSRKLKPF